jgi:hypothetical protein
LGLFVKAVAITGKNCQKRKTDQSGIARNSGLPSETKNHDIPMQAANAPNPPMAKTEATMMREASSILPRRLRRPFTNIRQRSAAMAVN